MLINVLLTYECEGDEDVCKATLDDSYRPYQGRVERFSTCHTKDGAILVAVGKCVSFSVETLYTTER